MHLLIIGGSGRTGQLVIKEALSRGHKVTALVRKLSSLPAQDKLIIVEGTPLKPEDIQKAFIADESSTPTAVVVTLNARRTSDSPFAAPAPDTPPRMMADSVANIVSVMEQYNVDKIVINSALGTGSSFDAVNCLLKPVFSYSNMKHQMVDHNAVDKETRKSGVNFVLVRPCMLVEGAPAEVKVYTENGKGSGFMPKITRESVARFMVVDALEGQDFDGKAPVITN